MEYCGDERLNYHTIAEQITGYKLNKFEINSITTDEDGR
jgi:hypothetical protein